MGPARNSHAPQMVRFTPDGRFAISSGSDETLVVWDVNTGRSIRFLEGHTSEVKGAAPTGDAHWLPSIAGLVGIVGAVAAVRPAHRSTGPCDFVVIGRQVAGRAAVVSRSMRAGRCAWSVCSST